MNMKYLILFLFFVPICVSAQAPVGLWKTIDDNSGEAKSWVEIYGSAGTYSGKVAKLLQDDDNSLCDACKGAKHNQPILGMVIIEGLKSHKDYWKHGSIMDPETGNSYKCSIWYADSDKNVLKVRGKHWTGLYRTQTWYRVK